MAEGEVCIVMLPLAISLQEFIAPCPTVDYHKKQKLENCAPIKPKAYLEPGFNHLQRASDCGTSSTCKSDCKTHNQRVSPNIRLSSLQPHPPAMK